MGNTDDPRKKNPVGQQQCQQLLYAQIHWPKRAKIIRYAKIQTRINIIDRII